MYALNELYALFPDVKPTLLANRLKRGVTFVVVIASQSWEEHIPEKYRNQELIICFDKALPVFPEIRPALCQKYLTVPHAGVKQSKLFYTILVKEQNSRDLSCKLSQ